MLSFLVIDMQNDLLRGAPKLDLHGVVERTNQLASAIRNAGGQVVWIQHNGADGDGFAHGTGGWQILPELEVRAADYRIEKSLNDSFANTELDNLLEVTGVTGLVIAGWATDYCVDSTVRAAVARDIEVMIAADCHTLSDRPALKAKQAIDYHNWLWAGLLAKSSVRVATAGELCRGIA